MPALYPLLVRLSGLPAFKPSTELNHHPGSHYSVIASRLYQRVSVAVQRAIAYNIMEYRLWRVPVAVPGVWQLAGNKGGGAKGERTSVPL